MEGRRSIKVIRVNHLVANGFRAGHPFLVPSSWSLSCNYSLKISISKHPQILKLSLVSNTLKIP